jgi:hypothetical protein
MSDNTHVWFAGREQSTFPLEADDLVVFDDFQKAFAYAIAEANRTDTIWVVVRAESFTLH